MKTPTLIVRLIGLYLLATCSMTLMQISQAVGPGRLGAQEQSIVFKMQVYATIGLIAGLAATLFAGFLARLLTFDAEPATADFSERVLRRKSGEIQNARARLGGNLKHQSLCISPSPVSSA